jgi:DNA repair protein RecN (Recombination protein N)
MLISLSIKNFLIIETVYIDFSSGLSVITGETGSGKSLIIDALLFCFGAKMDNHIRQNAEQCIVVAEIDIKFNLEAKKFLEDNSIEYDDTIIVKRQDHISQRKKFFINDQQVTQKLINQLSGYLLEVHGQHSNTILLDHKSHILILDEYADLNLDKKQLQEHYRHWQENSRRIAEINTQRQNNTQEISYLDFITKELKNAAIKPEEEQNLLNQRNKLHQLFNQQKTVHQALKLIDESNFTKVAIQLSKILGKDSNLANCLDLLDQALLSIDEIQIMLQNKVSDDNIEQQIVEIEDRLFEIRTLAKKHNVNVDQLHTFYEESINKLNLLNQEIYNEQKLIAEQSKLFENYKNNCLALSEKRKTFAKILEEKINHELFELISANASFKVNIQHCDIENGGANGIDQLRFMVSTNAGMPHMPIDQVASGGELSRIMLAIKSIILTAAAKPTIIFDEIDTGVGGAVADIIGDKLKALSQISQIISITHQPQIASKSHQHLLVYKTQDNNQTFCNVKNLQIEEKIQEIARMLSGKKITEKTKDVAKEMVNR